ncbi:MAG: YlxR family protein [Gaiellales bacterium]
MRRRWRPRRPPRRPTSSSRPTRATRATTPSAAAPGPERTCAGCGRRRPQAALARLSVDAAGGLAIGARSGRGTYLCPSAACAEQALRTRAIPRRLRGSVAVPEDLGARVTALLAGGPNPHG